MTLKPFLVAALLAISGAHAQSGLTPLQASVAAELPSYGYHDVDVTTLSSTKLAHIHHLLYSDKSVSQIRGNIGAVLGKSLISSVFGRG